MKQIKAQETIQKEIKFVKSNINEAKDYISDKNLMELVIFTQNKTDYLRYNYKLERYMNDEIEKDEVISFVNALYLNALKKLSCGDFEYQLLKQVAQLKEVV